MSKLVPPSPLPASASPPWRRRLKWGLGALLLFELLYNALLVTGLLGTLLTRAIDRMTIRWERAWSVVPGHVYVRELRIQRDEPNGARWRLDMEKVETRISLWALMGGQLRTSFVEVRGLTADIQIAEPGEPGPKAPSEKKPFELALHGVRVHEVRELRINAARITGITEVAGGLDMVPGKRIFIQDARVALGPGEFFFEKVPVGRIEQGSASATLEVERKEPEGLDLITGLTEGRLQLTAALPSLDGIKRLSPRLADLPVRGGQGRLEVELHVKEGRLAQGTRIEGSGAPLVLSVLEPLELEAPWRLKADVYPREDGEERFGLQLTLGPARLKGGDGPALEAPELVLLLGAQTPRLGQALPDVHLALQAARSKPLELRVLNGWLSPNFQVESGHLTLQASSRASPDNQGGTAHLEVLTENVRAHWGGAILGGRVLLDVDARKLAFQKDTVTLHGSELQLRGITVNTGGRDDARDWDGTLSLPEATLRLSPFSFAGRFSGSFSNATPLLALLAHQGALPHILKPLLTAKDLRLTGHLALGAEGSKVDRVHVRAEGLEVRGRAESTGKEPLAVLLVKVGPVPLGVEKDAKGLHFQVLNPRAWYEQRTGEKLE